MQRARGVYFCPGKRKGEKRGVVIARFNGRGVFSFALPNLPTSAPNLPESVPEGAPRCSCWLPNLLVICQGPPERALTKLHNEARMKRENENEARMKQAKNARTKQLPPPICRKAAKRAGELLFFMCLVFGSCSFCRGAAVVIRLFIPGVERLDVSGGRAAGIKEIRRAHYVPRPWLPLPGVMNQRNDF